MIDLISIRLELIADKETSRLGPHQRFPAVSRKKSDKILIVHALWHHMEFHFQRWCDVIQVIVIWITDNVYNVKLKIYKNGIRRKENLLFRRIFVFQRGFQVPSR